MRFAVLSDIHANPLAFETAIADARTQGADKLICLGDVTGYGYDALSAYELAVANCDVWLMGNHDAACCGILPLAETMANPNYRVDCLSRTELGMDRLAHMAKLPYKFEFGSFACTHGSFAIPRLFAYVSNAMDAVISFESCNRRVMFVGHTHQQETWCLVGERRIGQTRDDHIAIAPGTRYLVNVGAVGYPRRDPFSSYALYDDQAGTIDIRKLPFDYNNYLGAFNGLPFGPPRWLLAGA